jgi:ABC-2 type transport system ATP-binding protein
MNDQHSDAQKTPQPGGSAAPALAVEGLSHRFGPVSVLADVSFAVQPGEFAVLLGPNGAGKTTLFSLITRLYNNRSGSIRIFGLEVRRRPSEALARIGVVFQQPAIDLDLTVGQNLHYHAALHGMAREAARQKMTAELERLGMLERAGDKVRQLSGGQRRRVEIARALMHGPRLLLLDEPTVGLDIAARQGIIDHVRRLCGEAGLAVLWATHLIDEVGPGDRVVVLHKGRVRAFGGVDEVIKAAGAGSLSEAYANLTGTDQP